jgi:hypothetical protein
MPTPGMGRGGPRPKSMWTGHDAHGAKSTMFPHTWRHQLGGKVLRRADGFEAFDRQSRSLGTFATLTEAYMRVEGLSR